LADKSASRGKGKIKEKGVIGVLMLVAIFSFTSAALATKPQPVGAPGEDKEKDLTEIGKQLNNPVSSIWNITTQSNMYFEKGNLSSAYRGQFGKNHLGDLNKFLPTGHGFDEFFGYLYHLDAMSDPYWYSFPTDEAYYNKYGPRSLVHCWATDKDDPTEMPRWGKIGKQKIVDEGPLPPFPDMSNVPNMHDLPFLKAKYNMTTFDEELVKSTSDFMDKAKKDGKPFFIWHNGGGIVPGNCVCPQQSTLSHSLLIARN
jgi:hypothetical protein